jgi:hypothetical protein
MTKAVTDKEANNRVKVQGKIKEQYPDKVKENMDKMCAICVDKWKNGFCKHGLIPVCLDGADCLYFRAEEINGD